VDSIIRSIPEPVVPKNDANAVQRLRDTLALIVIPEPLKIVVGEAIHQTRSALDHFATQLAGLSASNETEFPIQVQRPCKPKERGRFKGKIKGFSPEAAALIERLQPYHLPLADREDYWLTILKRLNNRDKHSSLLITAIVAKPQFSIDDGSDNPAFWIPNDDADPAIPDLESSVNVESQLAAAIVFPKFGAAKNLGVILGLNHLRWRTIATIREFKSLP
jgi:hypothetical protein